LTRAKIRKSKAIRGDGVHNILQDLPIKASPERVFRAVSSPVDLDAWWTKQSTGKPELGSEYHLGFGPEYDWRARVTKCVPNADFELELTAADADWVGTRVRFLLAEEAGQTRLQFSHTGWPHTNEHYRISVHCWAMYLRILRRHIEHGEVVPYEARLDV
jgi:uncharacterized protein YndB with AHSA1/START domain